MMNQPFNDELISAYLDGELTAQEQAVVEQALVESAECRQMFDDLRALRGSLQALPAYQLPVEFSQRVIRRAERAMLREAEPLQSAVGSAGNGKPPPPEQVASAPAAASMSTVEPAVASAQPLKAPSARSGWRSPIWAFAALAAALLAALYLPNMETAPESLSMREPTRAKRGLTSPASEVARQKRNEEQSVGGAPNGVDGFAQGTFRAELTPDNRGDADQAVEADKSLRDAASFDRGSDDLAKTRHRRETEGTVKNDQEVKPRDTNIRRSPADHLEKAPEMPALPGDVAAAKTPALLDQADRVAQRGVKDARPRSAALPGFSAGDKAELDSARPVAEVAKAKVSLKEAETVAPSNESPLYVVRFTATREALDSGAFDLLLRRRNIQFDEVADVESVEGGERQLESRKPSGQVLAEGVDVVFVEATSEQIEGILADLQGRQEQFLGLASQRLSDDDTDRSYGPDAARSKQLARLDQLAESKKSSSQELLRNRAAANGQSLAAKPGVGGAARGAGGFGGGKLPAAPPSFAPGGGTAPAPAPPGVPAGLPSEKRADAGDSFHAAKADTFQADGVKAGGVPVLSEQERAGVPSESSKYAAVGRASRIAPPSFKRFGGIELRKAGEASQDTQPSLQLKGLDSHRKLQQPAEVDKLSAPKKEAVKDEAADSKPLALGKGRGAGEPAREQFERSAHPTGPERIRVLFVIRAVEQESPVKPN